MKKITVKLTAIVLSAFIFLGGVGGSYIEGYCAGSGTRFLDVVWNYDESVEANLVEYICMIVQVSGAVIEPGLLLELGAGIAVADFLSYMNSDKGIELTEEEIPQYFEDNVSTVHESEDGTIHGGGGMVLSDDLVDALHYTARAILESQSGYVLWPTIPVDYIDPTLFTSKDNYDAFIQFVKDYDDIVGIYNTSTSAELQGLIPGNDYLMAAPKYFVNGSFTKSNFSYIYLINDDWTTSRSCNCMKYNGSYIKPYQNSYVYDSSLVKLHDVSQTDFYLSEPTYLILSPDGRYIRVWKHIDDYKLFSVGKQPYYCTPEWVNYDYSQDNSITLTNTYLGNVVNGGVVNNYYNVVQDAINKNNTDGSLTENQIRDIVTDTINQIQQDNNKESDSGGSGSDGNGSGGGIIAIIEGIGKFFDTLLTLIGNVIGMIADFGNSVLEMFGSLGTFTEGFSSFLSGTFGFIPEEVWKVLISGITLSVLLLGIKFFK